MNALNAAHRNGGWVLLQNLHLTIDFTSGPLLQRVEKLADGAHPEFRCVCGGWGWVEWGYMRARLCKRGAACLACHAGEMGACMQHKQGNLKRMLWVDHNDAPKWSSLGPPKASCARCTAIPQPPPPQALPVRRAAAIAGAAAAHPAAPEQHQADQ